MRSISENLFKRLILQAEEAEYQGLTKVADNLTLQLESNSDLRKNSEFYSYSHDSFIKDIERKLWDVVVRAADFYNLTPDAVEMQELVEKYTSDLVSEFQSKLGVTVGAFEPLVAGEEREIMILEEELD